MTTIDTPRLDEAALEQFVHQAVGDLAAAISGLMLHLGDRLGLYRAMAGAGPLTPAALAERTGTHERYVREWLSNQAAGGYVGYDAQHGTFELGAEHALVLADEQSPVFLGGAFETVASCYTDHEAFADAFTTGEGVAWGDHDERLYSGCLRLFRPGYEAHLVDSWLPALDGVVDKLRDGASVADVGCGYGASTVIMARAFEHSTFVGIDSHQSSIDEAHGGGRRRRGAAADPVRGRACGGASRDGLRPGDHVRLPARHGRPRRSGPADPGVPGRRRHAAAGRAGRRGDPRGQPQPGGADCTTDCRR